MKENEVMTWLELPLIQKPSETNTSNCFGGGCFLTPAAVNDVYIQKLNISCWLIALTATHLLLLLSHRSWHEENSVIEKSSAWALFAHIWQMGHHRFKGAHLETRGRGRRGGGGGFSQGEGGFWKWHSVQVTISKRKCKVPYQKLLNRSYRCNFQNLWNWFTLPFCFQHQTHRADTLQHHTRAEGVMYVVYVYWHETLRCK